MEVSRGARRAAFGRGGQPAFRGAFVRRGIRAALKFTEYGSVARGREPSRSGGERLRATSVFRRFDAEGRAEIPDNPQEVMKTNPTFRAALLAVACTTAPLSAQVVPQVIGLGGGCGTPKPLLNATSPLLTADLTVFVTGVTPGCPTAILISPPVTGYALAAECTGWVDLGTPMFFNGVADARGNFAVTFPTIILVGFAPGVPCNIQAFCAVPDGTPGAVAIPDLGIGAFVSDGVQIIMGDIPKDPPSDVPVGGCCTFPRDEFDDCYSGGCGSGGYGGGWGGYGGGGCGGGWYGWGGCGSYGGSSGGGSSAPNACTLLNNNYATLFPSGLVVGVYNTSSCNAPNGKKFSSSSTGKSKLKSYLTGSSTLVGGTFDYDTFNNECGTGGGKLGREAAALTLNVKFHDANLVGAGCKFGDLVFVGADSSLKGATVRQILAAANTALAGQGLPAGYTFTTLKALITELNKAYDDCVASEWAKANLYRPAAS